MTHQRIIEKTVNIINQLPEEKAEEISDFADFIISKYEEKILQKDIQKLVLEGDAFSFLKEEEDLYHLEDLKEVYNDKR